MAEADWDPQQYERFKEQRAEAFWDLVELLEPAPIRHAVDLGCGTGELTRRLADRLQVDAMVGIDRSERMLAAAADHASDRVEFVRGDIATWTPDREVDLVFANASLHWIPDHPAVLARWVAALTPGGQLAVQVPANDDHASHRSSAFVAHQEPFLSAMGGAPPPDPITANVLPPEQYASLLHELGCDRPRVRLQVYPHVFPSPESVIEWTRGSSLTRFFSVLPEELHEPFVQACREEFLARTGPEEPYVFTFKRILMCGRLTRA